MVLADLPGLRVAWVVEPRQPDLRHADRLERVLAVDESADMIVVLMGADHDVERCAAGLRRDRCRRSCPAAAVDGAPFLNDPQSMSMRDV